jgi:hypothetical protein
VTPSRPPAFADPDRLRAIAPRRPRPVPEPWRDEPAARGLASDARPTGPDCATLPGIRLTPDRAIPRGLVRALRSVHETAAAAEDTGADALIEAMRRQDIDLGRDPSATPVGLATDARWATPERVQARRAEAAAMRQQSFHHFAPRQTGRRPLPAIDSALLAAVEAALDAWFAPRRRRRRRRARRGRREQAYRARSVLGGERTKAEREQDRIRLR